MSEVYINDFTQLWWKEPKVENRKHSEKITVDIGITLPAGKYKNIRNHRNIGTRNNHKQNNSSRKRREIKINLNLHINGTTRGEKKFYHNKRPSRASRKISRSGSSSRHLLLQARQLLEELKIPLVRLGSERRETINQTISAPMRRPRSQMNLRIKEALSPIKENW